MKFDSTKRINLVSLKNIDIYYLPYRLVLKNPGVGLYLPFSVLWALKMGLRPKNPITNLTHLVDLSGHLLSRNHVSNFFDLGPPSPAPY